jgi:hypothetical protein
VTYYKTKILFALLRDFLYFLDTKIQICTANAENKKTNILYFGLRISLSKMHEQLGLREKGQNNCSHMNKQHVPPALQPAAASLKSPVRIGNVLRSSVKDISWRFLHAILSVCITSQATRMHSMGACWWKLTDFPPISCPISP